MIKILVLILSVTAVFGKAVDSEEFDPFIDIPFKRLRTSAQRIERDGYPAESHFAETPDGYVLNLFRIPHSPKLNNGAEPRPVVFIMHGLFSCSDCFLLNGPDNSLPYNYADAGYDVWLGNARGNIYSRNNTKLSVKHPYFWKFSWHEIGSIDLPTMIDYILEKTGEKALHYVAHSQGCTEFFVMASYRPEYNAKIKTAHLLAPVIFMGNVTAGQVVGAAPIVGTPGLGSSLMENQCFLPQNRIIQRFLDATCSNKPIMLSYCKTMALMWNGPEIGNLNKTLLPQIAESHPAGMSTNLMIHSVQNYVSNDFRLYDWGPKQNMKYYNSEVPPSYDVSQVTSKVYLYYGLADEAVSEKDLMRLPELMPQPPVIHQIENPTWDHLDFVWALKVKEVINDRLIDYSKAYDADIDHN